MSRNIRADGAPDWASEDSQIQLTLDELHRLDNDIYVLEAHFLAIVENFRSIFPNSADAISGETFTSYFANQIIK